MRRLPAVLALCTVLAATTGAASVDAGLSITARQALLGAGGSTVLLVGTYSCGPFTGGAPDRGVIDLTITQSVGGGAVTGFGFLEPTVCDGSPQRYTAQVSSVSEPGFRRGPARWSASGYVEGDGGLQTVSVPPTPIRIR